MSKINDREKEYQRLYGNVPIAHRKANAGYSEGALSSLDNGNYKDYRQSTSVKNASARIKERESRVPELSSQAAETTARKNIRKQRASLNSTTENAWNNIGMSADDEKFLKKVVDRFGYSAPSILKNSSKTSDWEQKYGTSFDEIYNKYVDHANNQMVKDASESPILGELQSAIPNIVSGMTGSNQALAELIAPNSGYAEAARKINQETNDAKSRLRTGVDEAWGEAGTFRQGARDVADQLLPVLGASALGGKAGAALTAGALATNRKLNELEDRGIEGRSKAAQALLYGGIEGGASALATDNILAKKFGVDSLGGRVALGALAGAGENAVSETTEQAIDKYFGKDKSEWSTNKAIAMSQGMSEDDAEKYADEQAKDAIKTGAIVGGLFGAINPVGERVIGNLNKTPEQKIIEKYALGGKSLPDIKVDATTDANVKSDVSKTDVNRVKADANTDVNVANPEASDIFDAEKSLVDRIDSLKKAVGNTEAGSIEQQDIFEEIAKTNDELIALRNSSDYLNAKTDVSDAGGTIPSAEKQSSDLVSKQTGSTANSDLTNGEQKVRSFSNRASMDEELPEEVRNALSKDYYSVVKNEKVKAKAESLFDAENLTQTRSNFERSLDSKSPEATLLGYKLAGAYVDNGDYDAAVDVINEFSEKLTNAGQFIQAAKLAMAKNDPAAAMAMYIRDLTKLNEWGNAKFKNKWTDLVLSDEDIQGFKNIQNGDKEALSAYIDSLNKKFGKQIPASKWDKVVGATKTSMLLNVRTQERNVLANVAMLPVRSISDRVSAVGQNIAHLINPDIEVTQSLVGGTKAQKEVAGEIFDTIKDGFSENKMKDSVSSGIMKHRQIFDDDWLAKWVDNASNGGIQRLNEKFGADANKSTMETLSNLTYWLMGEVGDEPFVKKNFVNRLASYMKAQGIDSVEDVSDDAIAIATQEALKATFKDDNAFTKALQNTKKSWGKFGEVAFPFTKTPANLAMRAVDYSPVGLVNTIRSAKSGAELTSVIDSLSKNLTGTALIYLGYKLRADGVLTGNYSENSREKDFQKRQGMLENAFHTSAGDFTYDWAQPASTPLMIGSTIYDAVNNSDNENASILDSVWKGTMNVANSILDLSPLQSLSDMLGGNGNNENGIPGAIADEIVEFPQRFIPAALGALARTVDTSYRDTYSNENSISGVLKNQADTAISKLPFLSKTLPASYDAWGTERKRNNSTGSAALNQHLNPGNFGLNSSIPIDSEIQRIYDATGNQSVFPITVGRTVDLGGDGTKRLTNEEHSEYQKTIGQLSRQFAEGLIGSSEFSNLSDDEKASTLKKAYEFANVLSKEQLFNHSTDDDKQLKDAYKADGVNGVVSYLLDKKKADSLDMSYSTYADKQENYAGGAEQYAQDKQDAVNYGFVNKSGEANLDAYNEALEIVGNDANALNEYALYKHQGYSKNNEKIPALMESSFSDEQKGMILVGTDPSKINGKVANEVYNSDGYSGLYYYYLLKYLADTDGNGSVKKAERQAVFSDTSMSAYLNNLSQEMQDYLRDNLK